MAGLMAMPMVVIELAPIRAMFNDGRLNAAIVTACVVGKIAFWLAIWQQVAVMEKQFLKSMIPHHAGAVLMCERAGLSDPAVLELCRRIVESHRAEIAEMETMLGG